MSRLARSRSRSQNICLCFISRSVVQIRLVWQIKSNIFIGLFKVARYWLPWANISGPIADPGGFKKRASVPTPQIQAPWRRPGRATARQTRWDLKDEIRAPHTWSEKIKNLGPNIATLGLHQCKSPLAQLRTVNRHTVCLFCCRRCVWAVGASVFAVVMGHRRLKRRPKK